MIDQQNEGKIRQENGTSSTATQFQTKSIPYLLVPQIVILSPADQKLEILGKADGDKIDINPETEREQRQVNQRKDMFRNPIVKGAKNYRITFRDQIPGENICQVKYYIKEPESDDEECCPCIIY